MDLHQLFRHEVPIADVSYDLSSLSTLYPEWMVQPTKVDTGNSPNSPLSSHFDHDTLSALSNSQDQQYSSTENLSGISACHNSPLEIESSFQRSPLSLPDSQTTTVRSNAISNMRNALQELETVLMAPDADEATTSKPSIVLNKQQRLRDWVSQISVEEPQQTKVSRGSHSEKRQKALGDVCNSQGPPKRDNVKHLLIECAKAVAEDRTSDFERLLQEARGYVSIRGDPVQRLGAYMLEGLVARQESSGTNIYRALRCKEPESNELLSYMHILYDVCPYFKFGYMAANGAIAEAFRKEDRVHIIDFQIAQGTQWVTLIQALAARPGGPPHVRITGIDDPLSNYARGEGLQAVGRKLASLSEHFKIPVEFNPVPVFASDVTREMLDVRPGEALAVNFTLHLHHTPDESVDVNNPRDGLLRMVKSLSPKVTTLVEQESNTNTTPFLTRFVETMDYYSAMFESIDVTLARDSKERISVEQHCLARDIVNVVACEGKERVERHELLGKWRSRLGMAGFMAYPLSKYVNSVIRSLLRCYSENYTLVEKDGAMLLGWKDRNLISASAWH